MIETMTKAKANLKPEYAEIQQRGLTPVPMIAAEAEKLPKRRKAFEDLGYVPYVYCNADFPDELFEQAS
ncbi:MAG: hypothetical protein ACYC9J_12710 [Sulfuricaulis sp.]